MDQPSKSTNGGNHCQDYLYVDNAEMNSTSFNFNKYLVEAIFKALVCDNIVL